MGILIILRRLLRRNPDQPHTRLQDTDPALTNAITRNLKVVIPAIALIVALVILFYLARAYPL